MLNTDMSRDARVPQNAVVAAGTDFVSRSGTGNVDVNSRRGAEGAKIDE